MAAANRSCARLMLALLAGFALTLPGAFDPGTWVLEVAPILAVMPLLWFTRRRFPLTDLSYSLILVQAVIMMVGGHYTYARVPLGYWAQEAFHQARNNYDKLGHLAQGFIPALCAREVLLRCTPLRRGGWLFYIVTSICLAISACYEFFEWWVALLLGGAADDFLATQGDPWDTQSDMFMALLGAMLGQLLLARWQDRQLARLVPAAGAAARIV
jgi:putative membrane protein